MKRVLFLTPLALAAIAITAACSRGPDQRQPGEWETVTTIKSIDVPGAPPQVLAQARAQIGQAQSQRQCLTAEEARDPMAQMNRMLSQGNAGNCNFTDRVFAGGTIRIRGTCSPAGGTAQVSLEGSFTETTLQANLTMNAQGAANAAMPGVTGMNMVAEMRSRRIGDCTSPAPVGPTTGNTL